MSQPRVAFEQLTTQPGGLVVVVFSWLTASVHFFFKFLSFVEEFCQILYYKLLACDLAPGQRRLGPEVVGLEGWAGGPEHQRFVRTVKR